MAAVDVAVGAGVEGETGGELVVVVVGDNVGAGMVVGSFVVPRLAEHTGLQGACLAGRFDRCRRNLDLLADLYLVAAACLRVQVWGKEQGQSQ